MQERESIIFITKDAFCKDYLPCYGNQYWSGHTPNIDKLVENGSVFRKYYTGAPSTVMSNMCMFTGLYAHESELSRYVLSGIRLKLKDMSVILYGMKHGILYLRWKNVIIVMVKIRKFII